MELRSVRHDKALHLAEQKILCSRLAPEKKGNREIKREIIYLKGSITEEDIDVPEIDLKVVFGDDWKKAVRLIIEIFCRKENKYGKRSENIL